MRLLLTLVLLLYALSLNAQIGIAGNANFYKPNTNVVFGQSGFPYSDPETGWEVAVNYWFRLPTKRVEFMPTLYYGSAPFDYDNSQHLHEIGFQFKTNIYLFDFVGDCDCPTFGKQGPQLQKGLFLQFSPGYTYYRTQEKGLFVPEGGEHTSFTLGAGVGLDIGLSNLLTLTPTIAARRGFSTYSRFNTSDFVGSPLFRETTLTTFQAGIQLSFRFDHKKY